MDANPPPFLVAALAALLRHGLTALGAALVTYGVADKDQSAQITAIVIGLAPILASMAWSWIEKSNKLKFIQALFQMAATPAPATPVQKAQTL